MIEEEYVLSASAEPTVAATRAEEETGTAILVAAAAGVWEPVVSSSASFYSVISADS
jgi:hypothetical protein